MVDFDFLRQISHTTSILEVLEHYGIDYRHAGMHRYKSVCPFHDDHDPSLVVYVSDGNKDESFYCFVDNIGGDVFRFIQLMEQDFRKAWSVLCHIRGISSEDAEKIDDLDLAARELEKESRQEEVSVDVYNYQIALLYRDFLIQHHNEPSLCALIDKRYKELDRLLDKGPSASETRQFFLQEIKYLETLKG